MSSERSNAGAAFLRQLEASGARELLPLLRAKLQYLLSLCQSTTDAKVDGQIVADIRSAASKRPEVFRDDAELSELLRHMLRGTSSTSLSARILHAKTTQAKECANAAIFVLANIYQELPIWPVEFIQLYLEDACTGRAWVDSDVPETRQFIQMLLRWANPYEPPLTNKAASSSRAAARPLSPRKSAAMNRTTTSDDESSGEEEVLEAATAETAKSAPAVATLPTDRYASQHKEIHDMVLSFLAERVEATMRGGASGSTATLVDCLRTFVTLPEVRLLISNNIERWLQSPAVSEKAKWLLMSMAAKIDASAVEEEEGVDRQVLTNFIKLRQTIRDSLASVYAEAAKGMVKRSPTLALLYLESLLQEVCGQFVGTTNQEWSAQATSSRGDTIKYLAALLPAVEEAAAVLLLPTLPNESTRNDPWAESLKQHQGELSVLVSKSRALAPQEMGSAEVNARPKLIFSALLLGVAASRTFQQSMQQSQEPDLFCAGFHDLMRDIVKAAKCTSFDVALMLRGLFFVEEAEWWLSVSNGPARQANRDDWVDAVQLGANRDVTEFSFCASLCESLQIACASEAAVAFKGLQKKGDMPKQNPSSTSSQTVSVGAQRGGRAGGRGRGTEHISLRARTAPSLKKPLKAPVGGVGSASTSGGSAVQGKATVGAPGMKMGVPAAVTAAELQAKQDQDDRAANLSVLVATLNEVVRMQELGLIALGMRLQARGTIPLPDQRAGVNASVFTIDTHHSPLPAQDEHQPLPMIAQQDAWLEMLKRLLLLVTIQISPDLDNVTPTIVKNCLMVSSPLLCFVATIVRRSSRTLTQLQQGVGVVEHILYRASRGVDKVHHVIEKSSPDTAPTMDRIACFENWLQVDDVVVVDTLFSICELPVQYRSKTIDIEEIKGGRQVVLRSVFWRVCNCLLLLGCGRPSVIGRHLWSHVPTMRSLMLMTICQKFEFPPPGMADFHNQPATTPRRSIQQRNADADGEALKHIDFVRLSESELAKLESEVWELLFGTLTRRERQQTEKVSLARTRPPLSPPKPKQSQQFSVRKPPRKISTPSTERIVEQPQPGSQLTTTSRRSGRVRRHRFSVLDVVGSDDELDEIEEWAAVQPSKRSKPSQPSQSGPSRVAAAVKPPKPRGADRTAPKSKRSTRADTPYGPPEKQELMMICFGDDLRQPSQDMLEQFQRMNKVFGLGGVLRECTDPDFIAAAVSSEGSDQISRDAVEESSEWLIPAIALDAQVIFRRIPVSAVCQLLLMAMLQLHNKGVSDFSAINTAATVDETSEFGNRRRRRALSDVSDYDAADAEDSKQQVQGTLERADVVRPLVQHVRNAVSELVNTLSNIDSSTPSSANAANQRQLRRILQAFLTELSDASNGRRVAARSALDLIFPSPTLAATRATTGLSWLDVLMFEAPYKECLKGHVIRWIRKAVLVETEMHFMLCYMAAVCDYRESGEAQPELDFNCESIVLQLLSTRPLATGTESFYQPVLLERIALVIGRSLGLASRCVNGNEELERLREEDEAVRHVLMLDVGEDVSKDVPSALGIRLVPVQQAVQSLNMRLLIPRALMRMVIIATSSPDNGQRRSFNPTWLATLESSLVSLSSLLQAVPKGEFLSGVSDLVAEATTVPSIALAEFATKLLSPENLVRSVLASRTTEYLTVAVATLDSWLQQPRSAEYEQIISVLTAPSVASKATTARTIAQRLLSFLNLHAGESDFHRLKQSALYRQISDAPTTSSRKRKLPAASGAEASQAPASKQKSTAVTIPETELPLEWASALGSLFESPQQRRNSIALLKHMQSSDGKFATKTVLHNAWVYFVAADATRDVESRLAESQLGQFDARQFREFQELVGMLIPSQQKEPRAPEVGRVVMQQLQSWQMPKLIRPLASFVLSEQPVEDSTMRDWAVIALGVLLDHLCSTLEQQSQKEATSKASTDDAATIRPLMAHMLTVFQETTGPLLDRLVSACTRVGKSSLDESCEKAVSGFQRCWTMLCEHELAFMEAHLPVIFPLLFPASPAQQPTAIVVKPVVLALLQLLFDCYMKRPNETLQLFHDYISLSPATASTTTSAEVEMKVQEIDRRPAAAETSDTESDPIENYAHRTMPRLFDSDSDDSDDDTVAQRRLPRRRYTILYDSDESDELEVVDEPVNMSAVRLEGELTREQQLTAFHLSILAELARRDFQCVCSTDMWLQMVLVSISEGVLPEQASPANGADDREGSLLSRWSFASTADALAALERFAGRHPVLLMKHMTTVRDILSSDAVGLLTKHRSRNGAPKAPTTLQPLQATDVHLKAGQQKGQRILPEVTVTLKGWGFFVTPSIWCAVCRWMELIPNALLGHERALNSSGLQDIMNLSIKLIEVRSGMAPFVASTEMDVAALEAAIRRIVQKVDSGSVEIRAYLRYHPAVSLL